MRCQACGAVGPTALVKFRQNIGLLVMRLTKSIEGELCSACISSHFWKMTLTNLFLGWWGVISFFVTPFNIIANIASYVGSIGMNRKREGSG